MSSKRSSITRPHPHKAVAPPPKTPTGPKGRPGRKPRPVIELPEPLWREWEDPPGFAEALDLHMNRHGDTDYGLWRALSEGGHRDAPNVTTLRVWRHAARAPQQSKSLRILLRIEERYRLPRGYFRGKLPDPSRAVVHHHIPGASMAERRRLAWHLPDDFDELSLAKREEILAWVRTVVIAGATDYRRYQAAALRQRYAIRFTGLLQLSRWESDEADVEDLDDQDEDLGAGAIPAPLPLDREMSDLLAFKTANLTAPGRKRNGVWGPETAAQKAEHLGLMFGALAASPSGEIQGFGARLGRLTLGLLVFPAVWDWYLQWRERRRGFYTRWEVMMLVLAGSLSRSETGWLRQTPQLARRLRPIPGLVSRADIEAALQDWDGLCDVVHDHVLQRSKEIARIARVHRDPFEPILPILESDSPLAAYRRITEEIRRHRPDAQLYPLAAAENVRAFLLLRIGLHLGVRQKNLRQLLVCLPGRTPTPERRLELLKRGELRWSERDKGWEVLIPAAAFKNAHSSYFANRPLRVVLPDLGGLYSELDAYLRRHRARLLGHVVDPGVLFIKTVQSRSRHAAYTQTSFYEAWRLTIQRYGVFNPYTGRGAIPGLLPHGPHNVRDVLATHVLKQTGSYEQASYAIQDTPDTVARHYGRFLPQDKAALAARILNQVWSDDHEAGAG